MLKYIAFGEGDTAPVMHEVLRQPEKDPESRRLAGRRVKKLKGLSSRLRKSVPGRAGACRESSRFGSGNLRTLFRSRARSSGRMLRLQQPVSFVLEFDSPCESVQTVET